MGCYLFFVCNSAVVKSAAITIHMPVIDIPLGFSLNRQIPRTVAKTTPHNCIEAPRTRFPLLQPRVTNNWFNNPKKQIPVNGKRLSSEWGDIPVAEVITIPKQRHAKLE